jgi:hypothetical protein
LEVVVIARLFPLLAKEGDCGWKLDG